MGNGLLRRIYGANLNSLLPASLSRFTLFQNWPSLGIVPYSCGLLCIKEVTEKQENLVFFLIRTSLKCFTGKHYLFLRSNNLGPLTYLQNRFSKTRRWILEIPFTAISYCHYFVMRIPKGWLRRRYCNRWIYRRKWCMSPGFDLL